MSEYIERDKAIDACFNGWNNNAHDCAENIRLIPAADVRPVARGKWEPVVAANEDGSPYQAGIRCSECGHFDVWEFNFCPNCGCAMEEG